MVDVVVQVVVFGSGVQVASEAATGGVALLDERRADCSVVEPSPSRQVAVSIVSNMPLCVNCQDRPQNIEKWMGQDTDRSNESGQVCISIGLDQIVLKVV